MNQVRTDLALTQRPLLVCFALVQKATCQTVLASTGNTPMTVFARR